MTLPALWIRTGLTPGLALVMASLLISCASDDPDGNSAANQDGPSRLQENRPDPGVITSLPYLNTVPDRDSGKSGVVVNLEGRTWPGLNLYTLRTIPEARLIDMDGTLIHRWDSELAQPAPGEAAIMDFLLGWHHVEPLGEGRILAIVENRALLALDRDSKLLWMAELGVHHDATRSRAGVVYTLEARLRSHQLGSTTYPILDEAVVELSETGEVLSSLSILDLLLGHERTADVIRQYIQARLAAYNPEGIARYEAGLRRSHARLGKENVDAHLELLRDVLAGRDSGTLAMRLGVLRNSPSDLLHTNSVEYLGAHPNGFWNEGDLLVSIRNVDMLVIIDMSKKKLRWVWGPGIVDQLHQPGATSRGTILLFDNGRGARRSRILEIDPAEDKMLWSFEGTPPSDFISPIRGGCEALPNGNILITESERGRVFEVTPSKEKVWEFYSTQIKRDGKRRAPIYRMARLDRDWVLPGRSAQTAN